MSAPIPEDTRQPSSNSNERVVTESMNSIDVYVDAKGDTAIVPIHTPLLRQLRPEQSANELSEPKTS
jgi:hypothetical protein